MTDDVLLEAEGIAFRYANARGVDNISLRLRRGEVLGLLGLNGAGKSTTLRLLGGSLAANAGTVRIEGLVLRLGSTTARRRLGNLPEVAPLYAELTVDEQLRLSARAHGLSARSARAAAARARQRCGLDEVARRRIQALSQGMRRRLGLAQAIVHSPSVLLLDEPTVALDPVQIVQVRALIRDLSRDSAVILSTHLLNEVESVCSKVAVLHEGRLVHQQSLQPPPSATRILVALASDPGLDAMRAVVDTPVTALPNGRYLIETDDAARLARRVVEHGWDLRELTPQAETLERTFIALTRGDGGVDA